MKGITMDQFRETAPGEPSGEFCTFRGEMWYRISSYDAIPPFFMTIVSSSDVWNYLWSNGGITAGRINCDNAVFPYCTADKVSDNRYNTGSYTALRVYQDGKIYLWEPFADTANGLWTIQRNLYKNTSGSRVVFEEVNKDLDVTFQYGWTSSDKYGLVKESRVIDGGTRKRKMEILDGCRNILPACVTADFQNANSVLLDAYKKTDLIQQSALAVFSVTSIITDKAEPSEGLYANAAWFSGLDPVHLSPASPECFRTGRAIPDVSVVKGERPAMYTLITLAENRSEAERNWFQVFDTSLDHTRLMALDKALRNRSAIVRDLEQDITAQCRLLDEYIAAADGDQHTADTAVCVHHKANVMFNIMRGGIFADNGLIPTKDFLAFARERNRAVAVDLEKTLAGAGEKITADELEAVIRKSGSVQAERLRMEYLPLTFSRRHGDPSRPWNRFSIDLKNPDGSQKLNYQGNWRDIFQNWEALALSYPRSISNMVAKFLNAMTADGFNPYRITREGIDWEIKELDNPWSNIGYWGDHQVIYLTKLLEVQYRFEREALLQSLDRACHSTANVPYRIKPYADIVKDPRSTIIFDDMLHEKIMEDVAEYGSDARLLRDASGAVSLVSATTKFLTILSAKMANFVPGGGIWLNTQRPEWNDANNALAGYGLSMVTLYYIRRTLVFLLQLYRESPLVFFSVPRETAQFFLDLAELYRTSEPGSLLEGKSRRAFVDRAGLLFETQRNEVYRAGYNTESIALPKDAVLSGFEAFLKHTEDAIEKNRRDDGLYHSYNTLEVDASGAMQVHNLTEMLEGQVAVLSSGKLDSQEVVDLCAVLKKSRLFREDQYSYILYPDKELPHFCEKNTFFAAEAEKIPLLAKMIREGDSRIVRKDEDGLCHFNPGFRNARVMDELFDTIRKNPEQGKNLDEKTVREIHELYERVFDHRSFTGRSGTFYAYEGLGSIYWHMVSKLLLAVQEQCSREENPELKKKLTTCYYDIRKGIGFNKTPQVYGAFPTDPYSHTPAGQGAKQPGMTGQVKEEVITRWTELGLTVEDGILSLRCPILDPAEFRDDGTLEFTWCGVPFTYRKAANRSEESIEIVMDGKTVTRKGTGLTREESDTLFSRSGRISEIRATVHAGEAFPAN